MAKIRFGPYKEPIFPKAEEDLTMDGVIRYKTAEPFDAIARFYQEFYADRKVVQTMRSESDGFDVFCVGAGPKATDVDFASIVIMIDRTTIKKRKHIWHILVTGR